MYERNTDIGHLLFDRNASAKYSDSYSSDDKKYFIKDIKAKEITDNILSFEFLKQFHQSENVTQNVNENNSRYEYSDKDIDNLAAKLISYDDDLQVDKMSHDLKNNAIAETVEAVDISDLLISCGRMYFIICDKFLPYTRYMENFYYNYTFLPKYSNASVKLLNKNSIKFAAQGANYARDINYENESKIVKDRMDSNMASIMEVSGANDERFKNAENSENGAEHIPLSDREAKIITGKEYVSMLSEFSIKDKAAIDAMFLIYRGAASAKWVIYDDERAIAVVKFLKEQVELTKEPAKYAKNQGNILSMIISLRVPDRNKDEMIDEMKVILSQTIMNITLSDIYALRGNMTTNRDKDKEGKLADMEGGLDYLESGRKNGAEKISNESFWMGI